MFRKFIQYVKGAFGSNESKPEIKKTRPGAKKQSTERKPTSKRSYDNRRSNNRRRGNDRRERPPRKKWDAAQFKVPPAEGKKRFHDLKLPSAIMHAIADLNFQYCTPIQAEILDSTLSGRDATGQAQTGTGKTAAFLITAFTRLMRKRTHDKRQKGAPRALVLAPTRELVQQIYKDARELGKYAPLRAQAVYGGMDFRKQKNKLMQGNVDILIATPGRLLDFCNRKLINLNKVEILVIDEADRMLDMGFIPDVRKIVYKTPKKEQRQTLFFSATMTRDVENLSRSWTRDPAQVVIEPESIAADTVEQVVYIVTTDQKFALLYNIIKRQNLERLMIFCNRRDETRYLAEKLRRYNISCKVLSGDVPQKKRFRTLEDFKAGKFNVMVATDVAGRGIHIEAMDHVINYTLPHDPEDYVHRIGRTGRAGANGTSISFACEEGSFQLPAIIEFLGRDLECTQPEDDWLELPPPPEKIDQAVKDSDDGSDGNGERRRRPRNRSRSRNGQGNRRPRRNNGNRNHSRREDSNSSQNGTAKNNKNNGRSRNRRKPTATVKSDKAE